MWNSSTALNITPQTKTAEMSGSKRRFPSLREKAGAASSDWLQHPGCYIGTRSPGKGGTPPWRSIRTYKYVQSFCNSKDGQSQGYPAYIQGVLPMGPNFAKVRASCGAYMLATSNKARSRIGWGSGGCRKIYSPSSPALTTSKLGVKNEDLKNTAEGTPHIHLYTYVYVYMYMYMYMICKYVYIYIYVYI